MIVLLAAAVTTWWFVRQVGEVGIKLVVERGEIARLKSELASVRETAPGASLQGKGAASVPAGARSTSLTQEEIQQVMQADREKRNEALNGSPDLQVLFRESRRGMYRNQFEALFRRLKLAPDQRAAFVEAMVSWDMTLKDLEAVMKQEGLSRGDPSVKAFRSEAETALIRGVQAVIGPDALTITREYTRLNHARSYVAGYGGLFSRLGKSLTIEQIDGLVDLFDLVSPGVSPDPVRLGVAQWALIEAGAQHILTPEQLELFRATTSPGQTAGRWNSEVDEALERMTKRGED